MIDKFVKEYRFLSNFYPAPVLLDGYLYKTVEHAFQAAKTYSTAERLLVASCKTPAQAKKAGKRVTLRPDWEEVKIGVMEDLCRQKFTDAVLRISLLQTGEQELVEGNWWNDKFWGVCGGEGHNHLGKILMKIRTELQIDSLEYLVNRYEMLIERFTRFPKSVHADEVQDAEKRVALNKKELQRLKGLYAK